MMQPDQMPPPAGNGPSPRPPPPGAKVLWVSVGVLAVVALVVFGLIVLPRLTGGDIEALRDGSEAPAAPPAQTAEDPARTARPGDCRPFTQEVEIDGRTRTLHGEACLREDGRWEIVEPGR